MKAKIHQIISHVLQTEKQREIQAQNAIEYRPISSAVTNTKHEYFVVPELPKNSQSPIIITGRFRSGSTLLWNIFRDIPGCTAYYEPFNERRWFDASCRGDGVDGTHQGVSDYWREYQGFEDLAQFYSEDWHSHHLYMDRHVSHPAMQQYVQTLIDRTEHRAVLQFNRIDFRLDWFKLHFPQATFVHLYRQPRNQWLSFLKDQKHIPATAIAQQYTDHFYLDLWSTRLSHIFPMLHPQVTKHPYERFYLLWKLSYLYGKRDADISIAFERLVSEPKTLSALFDVCQIDASHIASITDKINPALASDKWQEYASEDWYQQYESSAEEKLNRFYKELAL